MTNGVSTPEPQDPFYDRAAVHDLTRLFGRKEEFTYIYDLIFRQQCISIVGTFRIGKSSLLYALGKLECHKWTKHNLSNSVFILLDFADYQHSHMTQEGFFQDASRKIMAACREQMADFAFSTEDWPTRFRDVLQHMSNKGLHTILLMEAFDKVARNEAFDLKFFSFLRSLAIRNIVLYITASVKPLSKVSHQYIKTSPFFNIFKECQLGPLLLDEAKELIQTLVQGAQYVFTAEEVNWVIEQAGRHPFLLQITGSALFKEKVKQGIQGRGIGLDSLTYVHECVFQDLLTTHFEGIWDSLRDEEIQGLSNDQRNLKDEARRGSSPTRMRKIPELSESLLIRQCVNERFNRGESSISLDDLKEVLKKLDDIEFLGNSKFAETYYVTSHYEAAIKSDPTMKKGKIVLTLLREAHEAMRPGGIRTDRAPDWKLYNILYYHYFKFNRENEYTRAHLGIRSRREFYRNQDEAKKLLLEKVCALEAAVLHGLSNI